MNATSRFLIHLGLITLAACVVYGISGSPVAAFVAGAFCALAGTNGLVTGQQDVREDREDA